MPMRFRNCVIYYRKHWYIDLFKLNIFHLKECFTTPLKFVDITKHPAQLYNLVKLLWFNWKHSIRETREKERERITLGYENMWWTMRVSLREREKEREKQQHVYNRWQHVMNMKLPLNQSDVSISLPRKLVIIRRKPCKKQPLGNGWMESKV